MKRTLALLLALVLCLSFTACGKATSNDLVGLWNGSGNHDGDSFTYTVLFATSGNYFEEICKNGKPISTEKGTYEIDGSKVYLYENGNKGAYTKYKFKGDSLNNNGNSLTKVTSTSNSSDSIVGLWNGSGNHDGYSYTYTVLFATSGNYFKETCKNGEPVSTEKGTYEIDGDEVFLYENGSKGSWTRYKYDGNSLNNNGNILIKVG